MNGLSLNSTLLYFNNRTVIVSQYILSHCPEETLVNWIQISVEIKFILKKGNF